VGLCCFLTTTCTLLTVKGGSSMPPWAFHRIIQWVLQLSGLPQRCGIRMVGAFSFFILVCAHFPASMHPCTLKSKTTKALLSPNYSLCQWKSLHINSSPTWWWPKWLWACYWALESSSYSMWFDVLQLLHLLYSLQFL